MDLRIAMGKDELTKAIEDVKAQLMSGEASCVALRVFIADGTHKDIAIGGDDQDREDALAELRNTYKRAD